MADINLQRKKNSPSPWLLLWLVLAVLSVLGWLLWRAAAPDAMPAATPSAADTTAAAPPATPEAGTDVATLAAADNDDPASPATPDELARAAQADAASPDYARRNLRQLTATLVDLADRADLHDDPAVSEKRDALTSATARLDEPAASLRPGLVAAAGLMQAMQQKAYPTLEPVVSDLVTRATQLSGRSATPADQQQLQAFFSRAAEAVRQLSEPAA